MYFLVSLLVNLNRSSSTQLLMPELLQPQSWVFLFSTHSLDDCTYSKGFKPIYMPIICKYISSEKTLPLCSSLMYLIDCSAFPLACVSGTQIQHVQNWSRNLILETHLSHKSLFQGIGHLILLARDLTLEIIFLSFIALSIFTVKNLSNLLTSCITIASKLV